MMMIISACIVRVLEVEPRSLTHYRQAPNFSSIELFDWVPGHSNDRLYS